MPMALEQHLPRASLLTRQRDRRTPNPDLLSNLARSSRHSFLLLRTTRGGLSRRPGLHSAKLSKHKRTSHATTENDTTAPIAALWHGRRVPARQPPRPSLPEGAKTQILVPGQPSRPRCTTNCQLHSNCSTKDHDDTKRPTDLITPPTHATSAPGHGSATHGDANTHGNVRDRNNSEASAAPPASQSLGKPIPEQADDEMRPDRSLCLRAAHLRTITRRKPPRYQSKKGVPRRPAPETPTTRARNHKPRGLRPHRSCSNRVKPPLATTRSKCHLSGPASATRTASVPLRGPKPTHPRTQPRECDDIPTGHDRARQLSPGVANRLTHANTSPSPPSGLTETKNLRTKTRS